MGVLQQVSFVVLATVVSGCTASARVDAIARGEDECVAMRKAATPLESTSTKPIVTLQTRDHEVAVHTSTAGEMRFTISDADGRVLAENVSQAEFAERFADLHHRFEDALAGEQLMADHVPLDASLGF